MNFSSFLFSVSVFISNNNLLNKEKLLAFFYSLYILCFMMIAEFSIFFFLNLLCEKIYQVHLLMKTYISSPKMMKMFVCRWKWWTDESIFMLIFKLDTMWAIMNVWFRIMSVEVEPTQNEIFNNEMEWWWWRWKE